MKYYDWDEDKNKLLIEKRGISFEDVVIAIESGGVVDRVKHPHPERYPNQMMFYVAIDEYVYAVPFVEDEDSIFLKTAFPDRKATRKYLGGSHEKI
jgi:uncharacterized DUF497 family protein